VDLRGVPGHVRHRRQHRSVLHARRHYVVLDTEYVGFVSRLYWEMKQSSWSSAARIDRPVAVPSGFTMLAGEQVRKSPSWIERRYCDVRHFGEHEQGGHFAALENPKALINDIRSTFASLR